MTDVFMLSILELSHHKLYYLHTGGRDTAGLGGVGGPYRLDAGHDVHQVSQEVKDQVPEHVSQRLLLNLITKT